jgi:hypothetical protein
MAIRLEKFLYADGNARCLPTFAGFEERVAKCPRAAFISADKLLRLKDLTLGSPIALAWLGPRC